jgi:hypothetical protein
VEEAAVEAAVEAAEAAAAVGLGGETGRW